MNGICVNTDIKVFVRIRQVSVVFSIQIQVQKNGVETKWLVSDLVHVLTIVQNVNSIW